MKGALKVGLWVVCIAALMLAAGIIAQAMLRPAPARPVIRPVDHPRCFPPGTLATERFNGCPDSLPDMRAT